jgi:hypothetical protein
LQPTTCPVAAPNFLGKDAGIALHGPLKSMSSIIQSLKHQKLRLLQEDRMNNVDFSNGFNATSACEHCQGVVEHEPWCLTQDPRVYYAYEIVDKASKMTLGDTLILHSLGVAWADIRQ